MFKKKNICWWLLSILLIYLVIVFLAIYRPQYGFIESQFQLAPESRLPAWVVLPSGYSRSDINVTIITYSSHSEIKARMIVRGPLPEYKIIMDKIGVKKIHPLTEKQGYDKYPHYSIVSIDDTEEVFEQKRPEPLLYISDDPEITSVKRH